MTAGRKGSVPGGKDSDELHHIHTTIERLHLKLKDDYTVRWELDRYLLALHYQGSIPVAWLVLDPSDTYHYHNLPDLAHIIRSTFMGLCPTPWLQKLFNMFLCGKRYRRLVNTCHDSCQLTAATINTLHGLLLGLYPFNERRMDLQKRAWLAGTMRETLTSAHHMTFINEHPHLICLGLAEYIVNVVEDFCPVEWSILGVTPSAKSQCLAAFEAFREASISPAVGSLDFWSVLETESQPIIASLVKFFRDASLYQHKPRTILPASTVKYLPLALRSNVIQNSASVFGQLKAAIPLIDFKETDALEEIWTAVYTRSLPTYTTMKQMDTLERVGRMCHMVEEELHHVPICVACVLTKRMDVLRGTFRYDAIDQRLVCNECTHHAHVVNVNLLGRVLYIRDKALVLCDRCLQPKYWDTECACNTGDASPQRICCACQNTNIIFTKDVVDMADMKMKTMQFCYKHSLSCIQNQSTIYDLKSLEQEMCARHVLVTITARA